MNYAYATCLLNESDAEINEENLTAVMEAAGCPVQESRVKAVVAALEDVDIDQFVAHVGNDMPDVSSNGDGTDGTENEETIRDAVEDSQTGGIEDESSTEEADEPTSNERDQNPEQPNVEEKGLVLEDTEIEEDRSDQSHSDDDQELNSDDIDPESGDSVESSPETESPKET